MELGFGNGWKDALDKFEQRGLVNYLIDWIVVYVGLSQFESLSQKHKYLSER